MKYRLEIDELRLLTIIPVIFFFHAKVEILAKFILR
jgi:hypothetical protein